MAFSSFLGLLNILIIGCITPGPNNALLSASGMNFGYRRSIPHMLGVIFGHAAMEFSVALGVGALYKQFPFIETALKVISITLLLWLAYKIATAPVDKFGQASGESKPWTFLQAFFFQWINPKAWMIASIVSAQFASAERPVLSASYIFLATVMGGIVSTQTWTLFGVAMARILNTPLKRRIFNLALAGLLLLTIVMIATMKNETL